MNAPLSRYLTQFSAAPVTHAVDAPTPFEPRLSLTATELDLRLKAAAAAARSEVETTLRSEADAWRAEKEIASAQELVDARAEWTSSQSDNLAKHVTGAISELRESIAEGLVCALRPLLSESLLKRTLDELHEALEKLLADPDCPILSLQGPSDLIELLRLRCGEASIEWVVADVCEVTILAGATRVDTYLGSALAEIAQREC